MVGLRLTHGGRDTCGFSIVNASLATVDMAMGEPGVQWELTHSHVSSSSESTHCTRFERGCFCVACRFWVKPWGCWRSSFQWLADATVGEPSLMVLPRPGRFVGRPYSPAMVVPVLSQLRLGALCMGARFVVVNLSALVGTGSLVSNHHESKTGRQLAKPWAPPTGSDFRSRRIRRHHVLLGLGSSDYAGHGALHPVSEIVQPSRPA